MLSQPEAELKKLTALSFQRINKADRPVAELNSGQVSSRFGVGSLYTKIVDNEMPI